VVRRIVVRCLIPILFASTVFLTGPLPAAAGSVTGLQANESPKLNESVQYCDVDYCASYPTNVYEYVDWNVQGNWSLYNVGIWTFMDDPNYTISDFYCPCSASLSPGGTGPSTTFYTWSNPPPYPSYSAGQVSPYPGITPCENVTVPPQTWWGDYCAPGYVQSLAYQGLPAGYATTGFTVWGSCDCYPYYNFPSGAWYYSLSPSSPARSIGLYSSGLAGQIQYGQGRTFPFYYSPTVASITTQYDWGTWDIARQIVLCPSNNSIGYELDGYGGIHPLGGAAAITRQAYWSGWDIARSIVLRADCQSGYTLDGWGGVHPFASNNVALPATPHITGYWSGWDIARWMDYIGPVGGVDSGYVLDGYGGIHPWGNAPTVTNYSYWGWDIARAIVTYDNSGSGYVLDGWGGVHPYGSAPPEKSHSLYGYWAGHDIFKGLAMVPFARSGYYLDSTTGYLQTFQT